MKGPTPTSTIRTSANGRKIGDSKPFWSLVAGAGRAAEGLRADWQQHLRQATEACGFQYVRFHGLFHDDMHIYNESDGSVFYNFQYIDALFDSMRELGVRPFVQFGFCPSQIATTLGTTFWWKGNGSPPKDMQKWVDLVRTFVEHCVDRYGIGEVEQWYFEVWNEPNLNGFWTGTRMQYFELYEATVKTVKNIASSLRVGGPSTSNFVPDDRFAGEKEDLDAQKYLAEVEDLDALDWRPVWVKEFLSWCKSRNLPVDFVSCHPYPTDWALDGEGNQSRRVRYLDATPQDIRLIRQTVSESAYPDAEIHLTEWSSSPSSRDHQHDSVPAAVYIIRTMLASINQVTSIAYWTFTDVFEEEGAGPTPFHGGFGLINLQSLQKPTFHAFRLLRWLGDEVIELQVDNGIVTRDSKSGFISAIIFHYPPEMITSPPPSSFGRQVADRTVATGKLTRKKLVLEHLKPGSVFRVETLAPGQQGDVVCAWKKLGSPDSISHELMRQLKDYSARLPVEIVEAGSTGNLVIDEEFPPWSVRAIKQIN